MAMVAHLTVEFNKICSENNIIPIESVAMLHADGLNA